MSQQRLDQLASRSIARLLWDYSAPAVVGMLVMSLYNVIDRIYIGRGVGAEAISGLAITFPVMNLSAAFGVLIGAGASARISILLGAGDHMGARRVLGNSLVLTLTIGTLYVLGFGLFLDDILRAFGASDVTLPYAHDFMLWLLPGMLMTNLTFSFNNMMRASGYPMRAMCTMIIGAILNIALAPVFIFALDLGIKGAAIATDISMTISMVFVMSHFFRRDSTVRFCSGDIYRLRRSVVLAIISIGAAPSLVNAAACCINILINKSLIVYGSDVAVGAAGIFTTYTSLLTATVLGICMGMQPIVGYNYGAGHFHRLRRTFYLTAIISTIITTVGCIFGLLCPEVIAHAFTTDTELTAATTNALTHSLFAFWAVGFQIVSTAFFQSIGKAWKSIVLSLARQVLFLIPLLMLLPGIFGLNGIWYSFPVSDIFATLITALLIILQLRKFTTDRP